MRVEGPYRLVVRTRPFQGRNMGSIPIRAATVHLYLLKSMNKKNMKEYQEELDRWFKENKWKYWSPLSILARLYEECGEFARLVNHLYGDKPKKSNEKEQELEEEIGDIIYTLICFANLNKIDLDKAIRKSFDKVIKRDKNRYGNDKPNK